MITSLSVVYVEDGERLSRLTAVYLSGHSREQLHERVHGSSDDAFDRSIDVFIFRRRQRPELDPKKLRLHETIRGRGHVLTLDAP
jgi:DNA-binding response OmpR family regulator